MLVWKNVCTDRAKLAGWCMQYLTNSLTSKAVRCVYVCVCVGVWVCVCACLCCLCACVYSRNPLLFLIPFSCSRTSFFPLCLSRPLSRPLFLSLFIPHYGNLLISLSLSIFACVPSLFIFGRSLSLSLSLYVYICTPRARTDPIHICVLL